MVTEVLNPPGVESAGVPVSDVQQGRIQDGDIRYVLMRPDVLMEIGRHLPGVGYAAFLVALEEALYFRAIASFEAYRGRGAQSLDAMLRRCTEASAALGWGRWRFESTADDDLAVVVQGSPFAEGYGRSSQAVCAPIKGVLRAMLAAQGERHVVVRETSCVAQGADDCRFHIERNARV